MTVSSPAICCRHVSTLWHVLSVVVCCWFILATTQGLSNTVWAYATVGHYHPGLMQQLTEQVRCPSSGQFASASLLACWPQQPCKDKLQALGCRCYRRQSPQWPSCCYKLCHGSFKLCSYRSDCPAAALSPSMHMHFQVLQRVEGFSAINCSNTLWACATLRYYHQGLFEALLERMTDHLEEVEPQNVANCLYAFARVNHSLGRHTGVAAGGLQWYQL